MRVLLFFIYVAASVSAKKLCPRLDGSKSVYLQHEKNCNQFYQCSNGEPYLFTCPKSLHFNTKLNVCDWPQNADCSIVKDNQQETTNEEYVVTDATEEIVTDDIDSNDNENGIEDNENATDPSEEKEEEITEDDDITDECEEYTTDDPTTEANEEEVTTSDDNEEVTDEVTTSDDNGEVTEEVTTSDGNEEVTQESTTPDDNEEVTEDEDWITDECETEWTNEETETTEEAGTNLTDDNLNETSTTEAATSTSEDSTSPITEDTSEAEITTEEVTENSETTSTSLPVISEDELLRIICEANPNSNFIEAHPLDCSKFVYCYSNNYMILSCLQGTLFDYVAKACIDQNIAKCATG